MGGRGASSSKSTSSKSKLLQFAKDKYNLTNSDYQGAVEAYLGLDKSVKDYDEFNSKVEKVYREEMKKKNEFLNSEELRNLVRDTYGTTTALREMGLTVSEIKQQVISDAKDEIAYSDNKKDRDAWKKISNYMKRR